METKTPIKKKARTVTGTVISLPRDKTLVVSVHRIRWHSKYLKQYRTTKKYHAHVPKGDYTVGERVLLKETRPLSKTKRWIVVGKV